MAKINYLNSVKQLGEKENLREEIKKLDFSIAKDIFIMAKACLENNNDEVYRLLKLIYPNSLSANKIKEWPIFIDFRKTVLYEKFVSEHSDDFGSEEIKPNNKCEVDSSANANSEAEELTEEN